MKIIAIKIQQLYPKPVSFKRFHSLFYSVVLMLSYALFSVHVMAQQFDQSYLKWKAEQKAEDERLNKADAQFYLSKPTVSNAKTNFSSKNSSVGAADQVRLNSATVAELQQLSGVGEKKAQAIVEYRQKNGKFKSVDELQNVKGIGPKLLEKNRARLGL